MIPQSDFMVAAPVIPERMAALKTLLATINRPGAPGMADPQNTLLPFGEFGTLHFARFVIVDDQTLGDLALAGHPLPQFDVTLAFIGDCDGPADECLATLAESTAASEGLRQIFSHCAGFDAGTDLLAWMRQHAHRAAASYVNWIGRTVQQAHAEAALRAALRQELVRYAESIRTPETIRAACATTLSDSPNSTPNWCRRSRRRRLDGGYATRCILRSCRSS